MPGKKQRKYNTTLLVLGIVGAAILAFFIILQVPEIQSRVIWRVDRTLTFVRGVINPAKPLPTAIGVQATNNNETILTDPTATQTPEPTQTPVSNTATPLPPTSTPEPTFTPTAIPEKVVLDAPAYEEQDINNCGPATLTMLLRYYGWEGDQFTISDLIKPKRDDRNVNIEELTSYILTNATWLDPQYRVGGDVEMLKKLIAAGFPVMIEEGFTMAESYWLNDDRWSGHYLLLTGYDDAAQYFISQDSFVGANLPISYEELNERWEAFNRVYMVVYPVEQRPLVQEILGEHWDVDFNRQHALEAAQKVVEEDSTNSYAWFNMGTNLVYFDKYSDAAKAYDTARELGLPQRMLRYQFGPFFAYFNIGRNDDLLALADYALERTPNAEEAMLWRGWALYRLGRRAEAVEQFQKALETRPGYTDAQYGLDFVQSN